MLSNIKVLYSNAQKEYLLHYIVQWSITCAMLQWRKTHNFYWPIAPQLANDNMLFQHDVSV